MEFLELKNYKIYLVKHLPNCARSRQPASPTARIQLCNFPLPASGMESTRMGRHHPSPKWFAFVARGNVAVWFQCWTAWEGKNSKFSIKLIFSGFSVLTPTRRCSLVRSVHFSFFKIFSNFSVRNVGTSFLSTGFIILK